MGRLIDVARAFSDLIIRSAEEQLPVEQRIATAQGKETEHFQKMADSATQVGRQAELMVQQLAIAQAKEQQIEDGIRYHITEAKKATEAGNTDTAHEHETSARLLSADLASIQRDLGELEAMAKEAVQGKDDMFNLVMKQARDISRQRQHDEVTILRSRMADGREQMTELQAELIPALSGDTGISRASIEQSVDKRVAETKSRADLYGALLGQQVQLSDIKDEQEAVAGQEIFTRLAGEQGYTPKALPAAGETSAAH